MLEILLVGSDIFSCLSCQRLAVFGENISIFPGRPGFGIKVGGSGVLSSSCKVHSPNSILQKYISTSSFAKSSQCFRSRSRGRRKCADLSCTCSGVGGGGGGGGGACGGGKEGCEQGKGENCAIVVEKEEEGGEDADDTKDEEESLIDNSKEEEENNNAEEQGEGSEISDLLPKEMMVFHPSMEDLVELIEESKVMEEKELAAQLHFVVSYFIRVTSKQTKK